MPPASKNSCIHLNPGSSGKDRFHQRPNCDITSDDPGWEHKKGRLFGEKASEAEQCGFSKDVRILQISQLVSMSCWMTSSVTHLLKNLQKAPSYITVFVLYPLG